MFHITVTNKGIPIPASSVELCKKREWRSPEAEATSEEGGGIGLWIVDNIMRLQRGELLIIPTNREGITEVKLLFQYD